ncbi:MAG: hypothetical protein FJ267_15430, partial [Planctomycetes bacterium]|nr:hypothetical protein [Planctomycetota bacterium]
MLMTLISKVLIRFAMASVFLSLLIQPPVFIQQFEILQQPVAAQDASRLESREVVSGQGEWPQFRGPLGDGTWVDAPVIKPWPSSGLKWIWKQPIGGGYSGVTIAQGFVYTMDRQAEPEVERIVCFDSTNGDLVWKHSYPVTYGKIDYGTGPRASVTIYKGRAFAVGTMGDLHCLDARTGKVLWQKNYKADFEGRLPTWGFSGSPVVYEDWIVVQPGGPNDSSIVAIDQANGNVVWSSLSDEAGYCTPLLFRAHDLDQLVCWTPSHVRCVEAKTGKLLWSHAYEVTYGVSIAKPIIADGIVLVAGYWHGSKAFRLGDSPTNAKLAWEENRYLRGLMAQPLYRNGFVYLLDKQYGLTCFESQTGNKKWDDKNQMTPRGRNPQASLVWLGDSNEVIILNEEGELILARLSPDG